MKYHIHSIDAANRQDKPRTHKHTVYGGAKPLSYWRAVDITFSVMLILKSYHVKYAQQIVVSRHKYTHIQTIQHDINIDNS